MTESPISPCPDCDGRRVRMACNDQMHLMRGGPAISYHVTGLAALVCTGCGRATLYASDLARLQEAVRKHPRDFE